MTHVCKDTMFIKLSNINKTCLNNTQRRKGDSIILQQTVDDVKTCTMKLVLQLPLCSVGHHWLSCVSSCVVPDTIQERLKTQINHLDSLMSKNNDTVWVIVLLIEEYKYKNLPIWVFPDMISIILKGLWVSRVLSVGLVQ